MVLRSPVAFIFFFLATACTPQLSLINVSKESSLAIDATTPQDTAAITQIAPYKTQLDQEMKMRIGRAAHQLEKQPLESNLGNLVADIMLEEAAKHYGGQIDLSIVIDSELNRSLAQGPIHKIDIYELMPSDYKLYILELDGKQVQNLINYQTERKNLSLGNAVLLIKDHQPFKFYIDGQPFDRERTYTLAISDFLANGGENLNFLKNAKRLQKPEVKIRDLIMDYILTQEKAGKAVGARVEGRIRILP